MRLLLVVICCCAVLGVVGVELFRWQQVNELVERAELLQLHREAASESDL